MPGPIPDTRFRNGEDPHRTLSKILVSLNDIVDLVVDKFGPHAVETGPYGTTQLRLGEDSYRIRAKILVALNNVKEVLADYTPITSVAWDDVTDKPTEFPPEDHDHDWSDLTSGVPSEFPPEAHTHVQYEDYGIDTRANIVAQNAATVTKRIWLASDTLDIYWSDGSTWRVTPFANLAALTAPSIGPTPYPGTGERLGYAADAITDKRISNSSVGDNSSPTEGAIRVLSGVFSVYLSGSWKDIVTGFRFRERNGRLSLEIRPTGVDAWIDVTTGDSLDWLGLNGRPIVHNWTVDIGPYPSMTPPKVAIEVEAPTASGAEGGLYFDEQESLLHMRDSNSVLRRVPTTRLPSGIGLSPVLKANGITGLVGGTATDLDSIATANLALGTELHVVIGGILRVYVLEAGTDATSAPHVIRGTDYAAGTNERIWVLKN